MKIFLIFHCLLTRMTTLKIKTYLVNVRPVTYEHILFRRDIKILDVLSLEGKQFLPGYLGVTNMCLIQRLYQRRNFILTDIRRTAVATLRFGM